MMMIEKDGKLSIKQAKGGNGDLKDADMFL